VGMHQPQAAEAKISLFRMLEGRQIQSVRIPHTDVADPAPAIKENAHPAADSPAHVRHFASQVETYHIRRIDPAPGDPPQSAYFRSLEPEGFSNKGSHVPIIAPVRYRALRPPAYITMPPSMQITCPVMYAA
jgi:hypothetical protein